MKRPTIRDLAELAGVSVATVNRILSGEDKVRPSTFQRVKDAAQAIEFYGLRTIENNGKSAMPKRRFGFVLHQSTRLFYQNLGKAIVTAAKQVEDREVDAIIEFVDDLSPQAIASRMHDLSEKCDGIGLVAPVHPLITGAIETVVKNNTPVFALISNQSDNSNVPFYGLDNWKAGRTAAWAFSNILKEPGKIGILIGNHRHRNQEINESGFRSYFREHAPDFQLLEPVPTFETSAVAHEMTERLLRENSDITGIYISGGGITGVLTALKESGRSEKIMTVGYELMEPTRTALLDGTLKFVLSHPLEKLAEKVIGDMILASYNQFDFSKYGCVLPFEFFTRENI